MVSLSDLPAELFPIICSHLDPQHLKQARLSSRAWNEAARKQLFRHLTVYANFESFANASCVANDPELSSFVRNLTYSGKMVRFYQSWTDFDTWLRDGLGRGTRMTRKAASRFAEQLPLPQLQAHHQNYVRMVNIQGEFLARRSDAEDLGSLVKSLPGLVHLAFDAGKEDFVALETDEPLNFAALSSVARKTLVERDYYGGYKRHGRQFLAVVNALGASRSVRTFQQFGVDYEWFCDQGDNAPNDADLLACRRLHELALEFKVPRSFYHPAFPEDLPFETRDDLIHHLLANAEELRYLSLEPVGHPRRPDYSHYLPYSARNLRTFFRSGFHFHLRSLHLRGFYVDESFFRDIMLRCCGTLEELHVGDMALWGRHELPTNQKLIDFFEEEINADEVWLETVDGWVSMLCFLRDKLNLADFKLSGMLVEGMLERTLEWNPLSHETEPARVDAPHYSTTRSGIRPNGHTLTAADERYVMHQGPPTYRPRIIENDCQEGWEYLHPETGEWLQMRCWPINSPDIA